VISGGRGSMEKLVIVAISLILLTESLDRKQSTALFSLYQRCLHFIIVRAAPAFVTPVRSDSVRI